MQNPSGVAFKPGRRLGSRHTEEDGQLNIVRSLTVLTIVVLLATTSSCTATREVEDTGTTTTVSMDGSLEALQAYFNQHQGRLRFVSLLSPT